MKILQIGSDSIHVSSFLLAIKNCDIENYLLTEEKCDFESVVSNKVISFRSINPLNIWRANKKLKSYLQELKPDIIHIHQVNRLAYFVTRIAEKLKIPVITTAWGSDVLLIPKQNAFFHFLVKQSLKCSKIVTADSDDMILAMKKIELSDKYVLLQYGIDPILAKEKQKIVFSNRLHKSLYRIDAVINYFSDFSKNHTDWQLVIGGTGSETEQLKQLVEILELTEKVTFVGWLQKAENNEWYAKSTIYISIPESDGTSVSVLEAMSAGCIPVVADLPVSKEWIRSGENGVIEKVGENPIEKALTIDRDKCIRINSKLINEKASRNASIKRFLEIYKLAVNGK
jgi:glycosyltransferase involved in cell wall biosynthesis